MQKEVISKCRNNETLISLKERQFLRLRLKAYFENHSHTKVKKTESQPNIEGKKEGRNLDISSKSQTTYSALLKDIREQLKKGDKGIEGWPSESTLVNFFQMQMNESHRCIQSNTINIFYRYIFDKNREEVINSEIYTKDWAEEWKKWEGLIFRDENTPASASSSSKHLWGWITAVAMAIGCIALLFASSKKEATLTHDYHFSQILSPQNIDYTDTIGQTGFYFRMRDSSHTLWPHLKVTFFELKNKSVSDQNVWAVEARGLYRDIENGLKNPALPDTMLHRGIITKLSNSGYYQMLLRPVDNLKFERFGYWFSTFKQNDALKSMCQDNKKSTGIGTGISNYRQDTDTKNINKISAYTFVINKDHIQFGDTTMKSVLGFMLEKIKPPDDSATSISRISLSDK